MAACNSQEMLGVEKAASEAAIRRAYRKLAKRRRPGGLSPNDAEAARRLKEPPAAILRTGTGASA